MTAQTWLVYLSEEECQRHLAVATLGRLAVIVDGHPEIFPVNHVFDTDSGCVMFPTGVGTKLHSALSWPSVAFEVDGIDSDEGWSVLVVGRAEEVIDSAPIERAARARPALWVVGETVQWVRIVPGKISGRRIGAARTLPSS